MTRLVVLAAVILSAAAAQAQRANPVALERRSRELQEAFVRGLDELADEYDAAGMSERAKETLRKRLELADDDAVRGRLEEMEERDFEQNRVERSIDAAASWVDTKIDVAQGEPVRIEAAGKYRLILNTEVGPAGLSTSEELGGAPVGSLVAVVYPPRKPRQKPDPGQPRVVDGRRQFEPEKSGRLFLRIAVPDGAKAVGTLDVIVSGRFRPGR